MSTSRVAHQNRRGLTLAEVAVSILLVGVVLVGALNGLGGTLRTYRRAESNQDGLGLAQQLMGEILQHSYEDPDSPVLLGMELPELSLDRSMWDDVDDYHGWSSSPEDATGTPLPGYSGWTRSVTVEYANLTSPQNSSASDQGLKRITVTVVDPQSRQTILVGYRSRWGSLEQAPAADCTVHAYVRHRLQVSGSSVDVQGGCQLLNHASD